MVQAWALGSQTGSTKNADRTAAGRGRAAQRRTDGHGWRAARAMFFVLAFLILFSGLSWVRSFASESGGTPASTAEMTITADLGDTLWSLAETYKDPSMDTRQAVHLLKKRNGLGSSALRNGQSLIVPAEMLPDRAAQR